MDIYFDNVGGPTLEAALEVMNDFGRVIMCGSISQYDLPPKERYGIRNLFHVTAKRLTMQGDHHHRVGHLARVALSPGGL